MNDREVYSNASVVLVAFEVRHPILESRPAQARMKQLLAKQLPLFRPATLTTVRATSGTPPDIVTERVPRYLSRNRMVAVTFGSESVVIETTAYERYEQLREVIALALEARHAVDPADGAERVGLRYIDEIRVPDIGNPPSAWEAWVDPTLLGPAPVGANIGLSTSQWQGLMSFDNGPGKSVVLRYGPREGYAVDPGGDLKRPTPPPGPFFLLDIDSFWTPTEDIPEFNPTAILTICDELHEPVSSLFESLISERLRKEVLRHAG